MFVFHIQFVLNSLTFLLVYDTINNNINYNYDNVQLSLQRIAQIILIIYGTKQSYYILPISSSIDIHIIFSMMLL